VARGEARGERFSNPLWIQTGGAAFMREGPNLLKLARKEQCMALLAQLRTKFKLDGRVYRVFPSGEVQYLHPKDGVYPEKVNKGRIGVNNNMRSIGQNVNPAQACYARRATLILGSLPHPAPDLNRSSSPASLDPSRRERSCSGRLAARLVLLNSHPETQKPTSDSSPADGCHAASLSPLCRCMAGIAAFEALASSPAWMRQYWTLAAMLSPQPPCSTPDPSHCQALRPCRCSLPALLSGMVVRCRVADGASRARATRALSATLRKPTWLQRVPSVPLNFQKGARRLSGAGGAGPVPNVAVRRAPRPLSFREQVKNGDGRIRCKGASPHGRSRRDQAVPAGGG